MCLSNITTLYKKPLRKKRIGWKALRTDARSAMDVFEYGLEFQVYPHRSEVKTDCWLKASPGLDLYTVGKEQYVPYFHVYADREQAIRAASDEGIVILQVRARGITCEGMQGIARCFVAQEIFIDSHQDPNWMYVPVPQYEIYNDDDYDDYDDDFEDDNDLPDY